MEVNLLTRCKLLLHYALPKMVLTRLAGWFATRQLGWLTQLVIKWFIRAYRVDMQQAQQPETAGYRTFNDFFVRPLRNDARVVDEDACSLVIPADGVISQCGRIEQGRLIQAKGHDYSLMALLAGNYPMAEPFTDGQFITIYLSPRDYHRVHMPCDGVLREMVYVPGQLFSVSPFTTAHIDNLFARNERVICRFDTPFGSLVQILVGATIVGSIETVWHGAVTPPRHGVIQRWCWHADGENSSNQSISLRKGQEMGRFKLGSTVITLLNGVQAALAEQLVASQRCQMGQVMGYGTLAVNSAVDLSTTNLTAADIDTIDTSAVSDTTAVIDSSSLR